MDCALKPWDAWFDRLKVCPYKRFMLGFGIIKFLFTLAIIAMVWYASRWRVRTHEDVKLHRQRRKAREHELTGRPPEKGRTGVVEDTERCTRCGAYVPLRSLGSCGRAECPYSG